MATQVDRTPEKIALAKELGLNTWVEAREWATKEINLLTKLTFKKITADQIKKKICNPKWGWGLSINNIGIQLMGSCAFLLGILFQYMHENIPGGTAADKIALNILSYSFFISGAALTYFYGIFSPDMRVMPLEKWKDNLPYGALLSLKEAKDQGLKDFHIWYPVREEKRVLMDPVITGVHPNVNGSTFEIFAWDDGKVYE